MADSGLTIQLDDTDALALDGRTDSKAVLSRIISHLEGIRGGSRRSNALRVWSETAVPRIAFGTAAIATAVDNDTLTLNGVAFTATQHNARGTVTCVSVDVADTVTIEGEEFAAAAAEDTEAGEFDQSGTDTETAASLVACIHANATLAALVTADNAAGVVTIRAIDAGTGGNAITLVSSDGVTLAVSDATLTGGAAVAAGEWDFGGTDVQTATALAASVNASTNALVQYLLRAANIAGTIQLQTVLAGSYVEIHVASVGTFRFKARAAGVLGADEFTIGGTDTADAVSLAAKINATPTLNQHFIATSSTDTVTLRQLTGTTPTATFTKSATTFTLVQPALVSTVLFSALTPGVAGNCITLAGAAGTVTASGARFTLGTGGNVSPLSLVI